MLLGSDSWNATDVERAATFPCDHLLEEPFDRLTRAVDIAAPAPVCFRWLCQLRVAPYSYDWVDNWGRQSPRELEPGLDDLAVGQEILSIFTIAAFEPGRSITATVQPKPGRLFGPLATTYAVGPRGHEAARLVVRLDVGGASFARRAIRPALGWGDVVMMRKQLLTLKDLAEREARGAD